MSKKRDEKRGASDPGPTRQRAYQKVTGNEGPSPLLKRYLRAHQEGQVSVRSRNDYGK